MSQGQRKRECRVCRGTPNISTSLSKDQALARKKLHALTDGHTQFFNGFRRLCVWVENKQYVIVSQFFKSAKHLLKTIRYLSCKYWNKTLWISYYGHYKRDYCNICCAFSPLFPLVFKKVLWRFQLEFSIYIPPIKFKFSRWPKLKRGSSNIHYTGKGAFILLWKWFQ